MPDMKPILFSTPMVQANLADLKSLTRRVITGLPEGTYRIDTDDGIHFHAVYGQRIGNVLVDYSKPIKPKYLPGDILWVREGWRVDEWHENNGTIRVQYKADGSVNPLDVEVEDEMFQRLWIQSSDDAEKAGLQYDPSNGKYFWPDGTGPCRWRPGIFMPKGAARIFLRVTGVRAERLQDITPYDAWREGCRIGKSFSWEEHIPELQQMCRDIAFQQLWDHLNAARGYGWETNPWVWVYEFERITREETERL